MDFILRQARDRRKRDTDGFYSTHLIAGKLVAHSMLLDSLVMHSRDFP